MVNFQLLKNQSRAHSFVIMINLSVGDISESEILQFYDYNVTEVRKGKFSTLND